LLALSPYRLHRLQHDQNILLILEILLILYYFLFDNPGRSLV